jgi:hypothetical protein
VWSAACSATADTEKIIRKNFNFGIKKRCFSAAKTLFQSVKQSEFSSKNRFFQKMKACLHEKRARDLKLKTVYFQRLLDDFHRNENRMLILVVSDQLNTIFNFIFSNIVSNFILSFSLSDFYRISHTPKISTNSFYISHFPFLLEYFFSRTFIKIFSSFETRG